MAEPQSIVKVQRRWMPVLSAFALTFGFITPAGATAPGQLPQKGRMPSPAFVQTAPHAFPIVFERNEGQTDPRVRFLARHSTLGSGAAPDLPVLLLDGLGGLHPPHGRCSHLYQ